MFEKKMAEATARELSEAEVSLVSGAGLTVTNSETEPRERNGFVIVLTVIDDTEGEP